jgi:hypothetical protein
MYKFTRLGAWQIKSVYVADGVGKLARPVRASTSANRVALASNKRLAIAYRGTEVSTWTWLHQSTRTATKLCQVSALAGIGIACLPTMSEGTSKLKTQPTKGK